MTITKASFTSTIKSRWSVAAPTALVLFGSGAWFTRLHQPARFQPPSAAPAAARPPAGGHFNANVHYDLLATLLADDRRATSDHWLRQLSDRSTTSRMTSQEHPLLDRPAIDFALSDHRGAHWNLRQRLVHGPVVLVFYLGYSCTACVHDLFALDADLERFASLGAEVAVISGDVAELTQSRFDEFGPFHFTVLSDPGHRVAQCYAAWRPSTGGRMGEPLHATFIIARDGRVGWAYRGETPLANDRALLYELAVLENKLPPSAQAAAD